MFFKEIDFSRYSSIKIGPKVDVLFIEEGDLIPKERFLIGGANNLLVSPSPPLLMVLSKDFDYIKFDGSYLEIGARTPTGKILSFAKKNDIANFEFLAKLPGFLGGAIAMNAGVKEYEIFNILDAIKIGNSWITPDNIDYGYRFAKLPGVVSSARFKITRGFNNSLLSRLLLLRKNQPNYPSAGSFFKNPKGDYAGRLIEAVGLKGYRVGNMGWSKLHANFLVNYGGGSFKEAKELIDLAKYEVYKKFGIRLEEEVKVL